MANMVNPTKVVTGKKTRWSYANVWEPKATQDGKLKYSVSIIIPKSDVETVKKIKAAIKAAYDEGQAKLKGNGKSVPSINNIKLPLRDGDEERPDDEAYANSYFVMQTVQLHRRLWMLTVSRFLTTAKYTVAFTDVFPSTSMHSTATETEVLLADLATSRKLQTVNLSEAVLLQKLTLLTLMMRTMTISSTK